MMLNTINDPADLRKLEREALPALADELRQFVIDSVITELLSKYQDLDYDRHFMH